MPSILHSKHSRRAPGFTLIEMLVIAPIVLLTVAAFIGVIISLTGDVLITRTSNSLAYKVQDSLDTIEQDVLFSGAFLATNNVSIATPQGYNNATQAFTNASTSTGSMLILNAFATTSQHYTPDRKLIPLSNLPNTCASAQVNQNQVMTYNIIYFIKDDTLWRRTLMPSNYLTRGCPVNTTPWQQPSCTPGQTTGMCRTEDVKLVEGVTTANFTVEYFPSAQSTTAISAATAPANTTPVRQAALSTANSVKITINATQSAAGKETSYSGTVRVTRVGSLAEYKTPVP